MVVSGRRLVRLLFPGRCVFCRSLLDVSASVDICSGCYPKIPFYTGRPQVFPGDRFDALVALCHYRGIVRDSIINYKFYGRETYFRTYATLLIERIADRPDCSDIDAVAAVPLHRKRYRQRGYNQSALLSSHIARSIGKADISSLIKRSRNTMSQSMLSGSDRHSNVKKAFSFCGKDTVSCKHVLFVDDILTTGNTMNECCHVLKQAGALRVTAAVVATSRRRANGDI